MTDDRTEIAALAMQGILLATFQDRPNAKPTPEKVAANAILYADALIQAMAILKAPI